MKRYAIAMVVTDEMIAAARTVQGWTLDDIPKRYDTLCVWVEGKGTYSIERINKNLYYTHCAYVSDKCRHTSLEDAKGALIMRLTNGNGLDTVPQA